MHFSLSNMASYKTASGRDSDEAFKERWEKFKDDKLTTLKKMLESYQKKKKEEQ